MGQKERVTSNSFTEKDRSLFLREVLFKQAMRVRQTDKQTGKQILWAFRARVKLDYSDPNSANLKLTWGRE